MKSIEEERDALLKGLQTVEKAEQWYKDQLSSVQVLSKPLIYQKALIPTFHNSFLTLNNLCEFTI